MTHDLILPSKPKIINEQGTSGTYEIDGLYPGYGHTLGNSLRRIILSSLPGAAVTKVKIKGILVEQIGARKVFFITGSLPLLTAAFALVLSER
jgi:hypothetical protein